MENESVLNPTLEAKLRRMRLRAEFTDADTVKLRSVPASEAFSKERTNLLIKRSVGAMPSVVCVDDDLEYTGKDRLLSQAFAEAPKQQGWRILTLGSLRGNARVDLSEGLELALDLLGVDQQDGAGEKAPARRGKLLETWAENLTESVGADPTNPTLLREEELEQVAGSVLAWQGRLPLILGDAGAGKTNLLHGVAGLLAGRGHEVLAVNMGAVMAGTLFESERESILAALLQEAGDSGAILAMEQAEWAIHGSSRGIVLLRDALDRGVRLIATSTPNHGDRFDVHPMASRLEVVRLNELCACDAVSVLERLRPTLEAHHGIQIDGEVEQAVVERSASMAGALPGKAVTLLDAAAARASLTGAAKVTLVDVYVAAARMPEPAEG
jgi:ATP-dependent Clp protease ATP-binding subunit ClpA